MAVILARRGVLFTIMAIVIVAMLFSLNRASTPLFTATAADTLAAQSRVSAMDAYLITLEEYTQQVLSTAGYFALENSSKKIRSERVFLANVNATVRGCIVDNQIGIQGVQHVCLPPTQDFATAMSRMITLARTNLSIITAYQIHNVWVTEENPLEVVVWMNISYNVTDSFASWDIRGKIIRAPVDVSGMSDPVYAYLNGSGFTNEQRTFSLTPFKFGQFNSSVFLQFYGNRSYVIYEGRSPSVLQRFEGKTTANSTCCGVESVMVRAWLLSAETNQTYMNLSLVDHQFSANKQGLLPVFNCNSAGVRAIVLSGLRLPIETQRFDNRYNLTAIQSSPTCVWP